MSVDLTSAEARALLDPAVPEQLFLAPPAPSWATDCHQWKAAARRRLEPPELDDCAPQGSDVADNDKRLLYHGRMRTVQTSAISRASLVVAKQILGNRQRPSGQVGVIVEGPRGTGKTALLQAVGVHWERRLQDLYEPDENRIPVIWLPVPALTRTNTRHWLAAFAQYLGQNRESGNLMASVIEAMRRARTQLVLIDGIERLRTRADADASFEQLEEISEGTGATFVYCGRGAASIVDRVTRDNETPLDVERQEELRGDHPVLRLDRVGFSDAELAKFGRILDGFDADLRLYRHEPGDLRKVAGYLHARSRGYMRALSQLICQGAQAAILSKQERITEELLEQIPLGQTVVL